ncbi:MAG: major facilitator superfamily 1 [Bacteroidetes bacterium]|nr:major facilitator superfamily 1 [Bacteroidota bacterium]
MSLFNNPPKGQDYKSHKPQVNNKSFSGSLRDPDSVRIQEDSSSESFNGTPEQSSALFNRISWRLLPLLFVCYIIAYIDRINVGFAKLQLREVIGVNEDVFGAIYGIGAGLFFIGYFLFELPSNLIMQRVGAKFWIARIMIIWGFVTMTMIFIRSTTAFYVVRFLLGIAEAGFFPGVILYLTYWYPSKERAHTIALFYTGSVIAGIAGSPLSGAILGLHGKIGLDGWQWLFLLEGIPAVLMAVVVFLFLPNGPQKVKWLSQGEKKWIQSRLDDEIAQEKGETRHRLSEALSSGRVWLLCLIYFLMNVGGYGYEMWMPSIIQGFSVNNYATVGLINAIPYVVAMVVMLIVGYSSDRTGERRWHIAIAAFVAAIGFAFSAYLKNPYLSMVTLTLALVGIKSTIGPFWVLGTMFLSGTAAAGGIALINSVGNLGGFVGPTLVGIVKDKTGDIGASMWFLGGALLLMGLFTLVVRANPQKK